MEIGKRLAHESNFTKGRKSKIEFIVIHYTGNNGDSALGNCNYFSKPNRNASAHYFVDEDEIWQSVLDEDIAWHCGTKGKYYHNKCRNSNAIGVELCSRKDANGNYYFKNETVDLATKLVKELMNKYSIPVENIIRHYDVAHKVCPAPFVNNEIAWNKFKEKLKGGGYMIVDRTYKYGDNLSTFKVINEKGENYIRVKDLSNLLGKSVEYNSQNKVTEFSDIFNNTTIHNLDDNSTFKINSININSTNYGNVRALLSNIGYQVEYNNLDKSLTISSKNKILNGITKLFKKGSIR